MPFLGISGQIQTLPQGWFYINPSRRGPVTPFFGVLAGEAGKPPFWGFLGVFPEKQGFSGIRPQKGHFWSGTPEGSPGGSGRGQGPGARG